MTKPSQAEKTEVAERKRCVELVGLGHLDNMRIKTMKAVVYPQMLIEEYPLTETGRKTVIAARKTISRILNTRHVLSSCHSPIKNSTPASLNVDERLLVIVVVPTTYTADDVLNYATGLKKESLNYREDLFVILDVPLETPSCFNGTETPGEKNSKDVNAGLRSARRLLTSINNSTLPCGSDILDNLLPQYLGDTISWGRAGSSLHRELASGLSFPVGFVSDPNDASLNSAVESVKESQREHCFLSVTKQGFPAIIGTHGNEDSHIIIHSDTAAVDDVVNSIESTLEKKEIFTSVILDCSSNKKIWSGVPCGIIAKSPHVGGVIVAANVTVKGDKSSLADQTTDSMGSLRSTLAALAEASKERKKVLLK